MASLPSSTNVGIVVDVFLDFSCLASLNQSFAVVFGSLTFSIILVS